ncbi:hypothetical protein [Massilia sp. PWRC2]|uniref:hypothetical protein n=1 Tax=Massilia sp. PWRC2 TaxID=2804626 RepID=UPI003CF1FE5D
MLDRLLACAILAFSYGLACAQTAPPANYESWGICPFECCTYRQWRADADIPVHQDRNEHSAVVFRLHRGEVVDGVTGVVVAEKAGAITISRALRDGYIDGSAQPQLSLAAGDVIYMVSPLGEGAYLFWYQGKVYKSGTDLAGMPGVDAGAAKFVWWKQVRNSASKSGWTRSEKFKAVDACG